MPRLSRHPTDFSSAGRGRVRPELLVAGVAGSSPPRSGGPSVLVRAYGRSPGRSGRSEDELGSGEEFFHVAKDWKIMV